MLRGHRYRVTCRKELRHIKSDVSVAELTRNVFTVTQQLVHAEVVLVDSCSRVLPLRRLDRIRVPAHAHQTNDMGEEHFVRTMLLLPRFRSRANRSRPKGRLGPAILKVLE